MHNFTLMLAMISAGAPLILDYDIHITNGASSVNLSVARDSAGDPTIRIIDADNDGFLTEIQKLINNEESELFGSVDCAAFKEMIPEESPAMIDNHGNKSYAFRPIPDAGDDPKVYENLRGVAEVSSTTENVLRVTLTNDEAFSPSFGSKINQLSFAIECFPITEDITVLKTYELIVQGTAFLVPFEERVKRTYSNYRLPERNH